VFTDATSKARIVARLNIDHYRAVVERETDEVKRDLLNRLLAEEEAKLRTMDDPSQKRRLSR